MFSQLKCCHRQNNNVRLPANYGISGPAVQDTTSENYGYLTVQICFTKHCMSSCWQVSNVL